MIADTGPEPPGRVASYELIWSVLQFTLPGGYVDHRTPATRTTIISVKVFSTGRVNQTLANYGDTAPMTATCCNACRTCVQTNAIAVGLALVMAAGATVAKIWRRQPEHR